MKNAKIRDVLFKDCHFTVERTPFEVNEKLQFESFISVNNADDVMFDNVNVKWAAERSPWWKRTFESNNTNNLQFRNGGINLKPPNSDVV